METVLEHVNRIQGVLGSLICDEDGKVFACALPPSLGVDAAQEAASLLSYNVFGLKEATGPISSIDLRFGSCRLIVKSMSDSYLMLICDRSVNYQLMNMSLGVAARKIEKGIQAARTAHIAQPKANQLKAAETTSSPPKVAGSSSYFSVDSISASSAIDWDQMKEEVAITELQAGFLGKISITAPIRKLKLTNRSSSKSKVVSVRVLKTQAGRGLDDRIALTLAAAEAIEAKPGDTIVVESVKSVFGGADPVLAGL